MPRILIALLVVLVLAPVAPVRAEEPDTPTEAERQAVREMVDALRADAARIRGLPWRFEVPADFLTRDQLRANLIQMVEEEVDPAELERDTRLMRRIGMLAPDEDPLELMLEMFGEMIAGYYNPKTKHLYLIEGMAGDGQKPVILHELIHALEDQYIDLEERTERWENDPDRLFAEQCIVEGSAEHARITYQEENPEIAGAYMEGQQDMEMMSRQMKVMQKVPAWMLVSTLLHYDAGPKLVTRYVGEDYPRGMAELYAYGPTTQEHFLHPKRFLGETQDYPQRIEFVEDLAEKAGQGWTKMHELTVGELDLAMYLDFFLGSTKGRLNLLLMMQGKYYIDRAADAAEGWDGGRTMFLENTEGKIAWIQVHAFDSEADATEATEAMRDSLERANADSWTLVGDASEGTSRTIDYRGRHGRGRLHQQGLLLYLLDGVDDAGFETLWPLVLETEFRKDPRDTWDPTREANPLEGLDLVNTSKGIGLSLPTGWSETQPSVPAAALAFSKGTVVGELTAQTSPVGLEMVLPVIEGQLSKALPGFDAAARTSVTVGSSRGYRYEAGVGATALVIYLGEAPGNLLVLRFQGPPDLVASMKDELDTIAKGIVVVED